MTEIALDQSKSNAVARTKARLEEVLQETQKNEAKLKEALERRRLQRRLRASEARRK